MTTTGIIKQIFDEVQGVSKSGQSWRKREYVLETSERYPKTIHFAVMNGHIEQMNLQQGFPYTIELDIESREYQGKWYHSVTAYRATPILP